MAESNADKPFEPTEHRLSKARERGEVPSAADTIGSAAVLALALTLIAVGPWAFERFGLLFERMVALAALQDRGPAVLAALWACAYTLAPVACVIVCVPAVVALVVAFVLIGPVASFEPLAPKFERLNPADGLKRIVSLRGLFDVVKGLIGVAAILAAGAATLRVRLGPIASTWDAPSTAALASAASAIGLLLVVLAAVALVLSVPDLMFQRWWFRRQQRMSREELERDMKETEGNPEVKRERMRIRYEQSQQG